MACYVNVNYQGSVSKISSSSSLGVASVLFDDGVVEVELSEDEEEESDERGSQRCGNKKAQGT